MASAAAELQRALLAMLGADAALGGLLSGPKIFDHLPASVAFPYVSLGRATVYDWSTATERGSEHLITLNAWSKGRGRKEAYAIMARLEALLHDRPLAMSGFALVNMRVESSDVRFDDDQAVYQGVVRVRAMVEGV